MVSLTVIGAGAIAQQGYLPAIDEIPNADLRWIVDIDRQRARRIAEKHGAPRYTTEYTDAIADTDAAIISTPPKFHQEIADACLRSGVHVLTEKPLALESTDAKKLVRLGEDRSLHYAISRQCREAPACRLLHSFANDESLGPIRRFEVRFGDQTNWAFASDYRVQRSLAGGGVLTDKGPHVLDLLLWLFGNEVTVDRYRDDNFGGLEANALAELTFRESAVSGAVEITGTRDIDGEIVIIGDRRKIVADPDGDTATVYDVDTGEATRLTASTELPNTYLLRVGKQVERFVDSIHSDEIQYVPASTGVDVLSLIEACYRSRSPIVQPWEKPGIADVSKEV